MTWFWRRTRRGRLLRGLLLPSAAVFYVTAAARARSYAFGWRRVYRPALPTIVVGNLSIGGTGKTPLAGWLAARLARQGERPAILLRDAGGDEAVLHRAHVPGALVIVDPDRPRGARRAAAAGASLLILDDGFQRLDLARDVNLALLSADAADAVPWVLPAGPWRESGHALRRADAVVVTRKAADDDTVIAVTRRADRIVGPNVPTAVVRFPLTGFTELHSGRAVGLERVRHRSVLAVAGIGDPHAFAAQLAGLGARVTLAARPDHYPYPRADVVRLLHAAAGVDYVVLTAKDAVKLRRRWPAPSPPTLVAELGVVWERGWAAVAALVARAGARLTFDGGNAGAFRHST